LKQVSFGVGSFTITILLLFEVIDLLLEKSILELLSGAKCFIPHLGATLV